MTYSLARQEEAARQRAAFVEALPEQERKEAVLFLNSLGAYLYDGGIDIGKDAAIQLAHGFLRLSDKVTELKGMPS